MSAEFFAFRVSLGGATDPANTTPVLNTDIFTTYPVVRNGFSFGYLTTGIVSSSDVAEPNQHLCGIHYIQNAAAPDTFRLDLAAFGGPGTYQIGIALGNPSGAVQNQRLVAKDGATTLFTVGGVGAGNTSAAYKYLDATGVERDGSVWDSAQAYQTVTITGTVLDIVLDTYNDGISTGYTCLACLSVQKVSGGGTPPAVLDYYRNNL